MNTNALAGNASTARRLAAERRGALIPLLAIMLVVFLGMLALTLDVGAGNRQRRMAQTAADAGAVAGAVELFRMQGIAGAHDSAVAAATREVVRNGFLASDIVAPCPCNPPITGPHTGDANYIEVQLLNSIATNFGSIFGQSSLNYGARGVGGIIPFAMNCIVSLDPSASGAIEVKNGGTLSTTYVSGGHTYSCGVSVNSTSGTALELNSSGQLDAGSASIGVVGGWDGNKTPSPAPVTGIPASFDPLAAIVTMPTLTGCTTTNLAAINKDTTLSPGVYCNGINVNSKTTTLSPGTYYMAGGGFTAGTSAQIIGNGVTIVTTVDVISGFSYTPKGINFGTGCKATLTAPTSGSFKGIIFFADPAMPSSVTNTFACASDDDPEITGTMYFPNQTIIFDGSNAGTEIEGAVIAQKIVSSGKVSVQNDLSGNSALKRPSLVE